MDGKWIVVKVEEGQANKIVTTNSDYWVNEFTCESLNKRDGDKVTYFTADQVYAKERGLVK